MKWLLIYLHYDLTLKKIDIRYFNQGHKVRKLNVFVKLFYHF